MNVYEDVLTFMREKDRVLFEITGEHIFDEGLYEETFGEEDRDGDLREFIKQLRHRVREQEVKRISDAELCPWCTIWYFSKNKRCYECSFGIKHGLCNSNGKVDPLYTVISRKFIQSSDKGVDFIDNAEIKAAVIKLVGEIE